MRSQAEAMADLMCPARQVLAGALQDNGRAHVAGGRTFGKGLIQSIVELSDGSGVAVTVARYQTPAGTDINKARRPRVGRAYTRLSRLLGAPVPAAGEWRKPDTAAGMRAPCPACAAAQPVLLRQHMRADGAT